MKKMRELSPNEIQLLKTGSISLIWTVLWSLIAVFLTTVVCTLMFRGIIDDVMRRSNKDGVQLFLEGVSYVVFTVLCVVSDFMRGKKRTKKAKTPPQIFLRGVFLVTGILIVPALLGFHPTKPAKNGALLFLYMPFLCLGQSLGMTQLSVLLTAFLSAGIRSLAYSFGVFIYRKQAEKES